MAEIKQTSKADQITMLFVVIGASVIAACAIAMTFLYYYNPTGSYIAGKMLVEPDRLEKMGYSEAVVRGGDNTPFVLAEIRFGHFDSALKGWVNTPVDMDKYARFFSLIAADTSLSEINDTIRAGFLQGHPSKLILSAKRAGSVQDTKTEFLQVDFSNEGNYYRINLRAQTTKKANEDLWVYFYHPGIGKEVLNLFK